MQMQGLAHVGLFITDMERSVNFYTQVLGFTVIWENVNPSAEGDVQVTFLKNGTCVLEIVRFPHPEQRKDGWFDHIAMNVQDLDAVIEQLKQKQVIFEVGSYTNAPQVFENGSRWVLFRGPDNEHIELNERL